MSHSTVFHITLKSQHVSSIQLKKKTSPLKKKKKKFKTLKAELQGDYILQKSHPPGTHGIRCSSEKLLASTHFTSWVQRSTVFEAETSALEEQRLWAKFLMSPTKWAVSQVDKRVKIKIRKLLLIQAGILLSSLLGFDPGCTSLQASKGWTGCHHIMVYYEGKRTYGVRVLSS